MTTPDPFAPGYRLTDGNDLNSRFANPQWSTTPSLTALAGGTVLTSPKIVETVTQITAASAPNAGVTIEQALPGRILWIVNNSANTVVVFAEGGSTIDGIPGNIGIPLTAGSNIYIIATDVNEWQSYLGFAASFAIDLVNILTNITALRAWSTAAASSPKIIALVYNNIAGDGGGLFYLDASDNTTPDNGTTVIVDTVGNRWKRELVQAVYIANTPAGNVAATTVQAAINEIDTTLSSTITSNVADRILYAGATTGPNALTPGELSVYLGYQSGQAVSDPGGGGGGLQNARGIVAIGPNTLSSGAYDFDFSVFIGNSSGQFATGGYCTVAVGLRTGQYLQPAAIYNCLLGCDAGFALTTGDSNVYVGAKAGLNSTTSFNNVAVGTSAMHDLTTGFGNVVIGPEAGYALATSAQNVAIGDRALRTANSVQNAVAIGKFAMRVAASGNGVVAVGNQALEYNTGTANVALGDSALSVNAAGSRNTALGYQTLYSNITGSNSVAVGWSAGRLSTAGNVTLIGDSAGLALTTGGFNTFVGRSCGSAATTGALNTAVGDSALGGAGGVSYSTAVGFQAQAVSTGGYGAALGYGALLAETTGSENVAVGYLAGDTITTGNQNVIIGGNADTIAAATNSIAIGYNAAATKSNQVVLGHTTVVETVLRGVVLATTYTVATLPAGVAGARAFVTDANATTFASIVAGGGANGVPVYHDGTNWRIG